MPTTSNFGWTTPADTDLVKDGAAAIRTLGNGIDTSFLDLKGGTTGQVLAKASNTDLDFTWSAADPLSILDAKGDLISATAADTPARLAVGTDGQYLQADSSTATGLKWAAVSAGGMTELASGSLSGNTLSLTSISGSYVDLYLVLSQFTASAAELLFTRLNNDSNSVYDTAHNPFTNTWSAVATTSAGSRNSVSGTQNYHLYIRNYAVSSNDFFLEGRQHSRFWFARYNAASGAGAAAISRIDLQLDFSATFTAGTYKLYGVK